VRKCAPEGIFFNDQHANSAGGAGFICPQELRDEGARIIGTASLLWAANLLVGRPSVMD